MMIRKRNRNKKHCNDFKEKRTNHYTLNSNFNLYFYVILGLMVQRQDCSHIGLEKEGN